MIGYCDDCGNLSYIKEVPACNCNIEYGSCCVKNICINGCLIQCVNNHTNISYCYNGIRMPVVCDICYDLIYPLFKWNDVSIQDLRSE